MFKLEFNEKNVKLNLETENWEDAIRKSAGVLVENGNVAPEYIDGIIAAINEYGPYIVISDGLAIPHTRPENGAKNIGFSLTTFKKPVIFDENTSPVKVMIAFSAVDKDSHLEILKMIVSFVEEGKIEKISEVDNMEELLNVIN